MTGPRPPRTTVTDELGRPRTLLCGPQAHVRLLPAPATDGQPDVLVLGLGPDPADMLAHLAQNPDAPLHIWYVECPAFAAAMGPDWHAAIPAPWQAVSPEAARMLARRCEVWHCWQGSRLFDTFWGPLLAAMQRDRLSPHTAQSPSRTVLLPGNARDLLTFELVQAFEALGWQPLLLAENTLPTRLPQLLRDETPALCLCVNGRGLDAEGARFHLLRAAGVPVALWLVDNPWHVLSAWRTPWWREAILCVTDASFVEPLRAHGAGQVTHLPLGAWMPWTPRTPWTPCMPPPANDEPALNPLVFVGRSSFPDRQEFFSGLTLPPALLEAAHQRLAAGHAPPDFQWWAAHLQLTQLWPGAAVRMAGLGAEHSSQTRRRLWLQAAQTQGLTVFGDAGWRELLQADTPAAPALDLRPPVDYYGRLPHIYAHARYSLNITSLLLPAGLTQRHFDVWSAGGFLLTDATPGLSIFPQELTAPVSLRTPLELPTVVQRLERDPALRRDLQAAWVSCLHHEHTTIHRVGRILQTARCA